MRLCSVILSFLGCVALSRQARILAGARSPRTAERTDSPDLSDVLCYLELKEPEMVEPMSDARDVHLFI
jgi:hypothetical protein